VSRAASNAKGNSPVVISNLRLKHIFLQSFVTYVFMKGELSMIIDLIVRLQIAIATTLLLFLFEVKDVDY
jgi:hypothetical protein